MDIGTNIRKIRELRGYSQEFLANQLDISQRHLSRIENNQSDLKTSKLEGICKALEISVAQLLSFDGKSIFQNHRAIPENGQQPSLSQEIKKQYESRIQHLKEEIEFLRNQLRRQA